MSNAEPPSYEQATGSTSFARRERNGITPQARRSIEDESRPLPDGWVRTFDPVSKHQFFVDTRADPPRSIWHHPYDDEEYMNSVSPEERQHLGGIMRCPSKEDISAETTDEEGDDHAHGSRGKQPLGTASSSHARGSRGLGRRMKDKLTGTTHEQRAAERQRREQQERDMYRQHQIFRRGLEAALNSGQPQYLGEDDNGVPVYLEPPGFNPGIRVRRVARLSPYIQEIFYEPPGPVPSGARYVRPDELYTGYGAYGRPGTAYNRPYGYGYGGGIGMMPLAAPLFGGMLLGGLLF
ncbi:hypothetical protein JX265_012753 [Neoarthrinium moseri]|uniref:WW domain-containing protein n=1 Tax=Neoarthrinium moseri TaxID=1658444 RepID=A0A9P9W9P9_9PEZI|nr:uncharacterized protein JN550_008832 [Neoarthrinium moseri]KAI1849502.1 hypothetical protein JX266_004997 [Neoarthrinium moseri]KAI1853462.1 hypothetical protein JX265_012753 [Neoarthrinium moseri]KAI1864545.1 hypothetical protein JN550_008832 [Neoarthrinium moseri]